MNKSRTAATEDSISDDFVSAYQTQIRFDHSQKCWFIFDSGLWRRDNQKIIDEFIRLYLRDNHFGQAWTGRSKTVRSVEQLCQSDQRIAVSSEFWDRNNLLLGTPNGIVDLWTGKLRPGQPEDYVTKIAAVAPADFDDCPAFKHFLNTITLGDNGLQLYLQRWLGYCLTGLTTEHALIFVYGTGANGKSTLLNLALKIFGDYGGSAPLNLLDSSKYDRHPTELFSLKGKRLVTIIETGEGRAWDEPKVKLLTGGDPITARPMYGNFVTFLPTHKIAVSGNHRPTLLNIDPAIKRRLRLVPFRFKVDTPDLNLEEALTKEMPEILRWMINGCIDWHQYGLGESSAIFDATSVYFEENDSYSLWLSDSCEVQLGDPNYYESPDSLHSSYLEYCRRRGFAQISRNAFRDRLVATGFKSNRTGSKGRHFIGIRLKGQTKSNQN